MSSNFKGRGVEVVMFTRNNPCINVMNLMVVVIIRTMNHFFDGRIEIAIMPVIDAHFLPLRVHLHGHLFVTLKYHNNNGTFIFKHTTIVIICCVWHDNALQ